MIIQGDCLERLREFDSESVDAVITDPPYNLSFMGHTWDDHDNREDAAFCYWLAGLIDGEGCFTIKAHTRGTHAPNFTLKMRADEEGTIRAIQRSAGFGTIQHERHEPNSMVKWSVADKDGCQRLVELLDKYPLRAKKAMDYAVWREAVCEWSLRQRGNRWHGAASNERMAALRDRLMSGRAYIDPPWSGHGFQDWCRLWASECLRVLKPGGHIVVAGSPRTHHRVGCAVEDAGFEIRDCIVHLFGQGFPKSLDVSKSLTKLPACACEVPGEADGGASALGADECPHSLKCERCGGVREVPGGLGTALKPAAEYWTVGRKPLSEGGVAGNVLAHGTGAINIAACRISTGDNLNGGASKDRKASDSVWVKHGGRIHSYAGRDYEPPPGRWPANVVLSHSEGCELVGERQVDSDGHFPSSRGASGYGSAEPHSNGGGLKGQDGLKERHLAGEVVEVWDCVEGCPVRMLDEQTGVLRSGDPTVIGGSGSDGYGNRSAAFGVENRKAGTPIVGYGDAGGGSRFFFTGKASRAERNAGLDGFEEKPILWSSGEQNPGSFQADVSDRSARNPHPTVKPIDLMRWLVRLVTPPGGLVLDPFCGSGSTGCAAALEGFEFVGIEREPDYVRIAEARIRYWASKPVGMETARVLRAERKNPERSGQLSIL